MIQVNAYFDGKVKSMGCNNSDGELTVGVMEVGKYDFSTSKKEFMTVISGALKVMLPGESEDRLVQANESFEVPANETFHANALEETIYTCKYEG